MDCSSVLIVVIILELEQEEVMEKQLLFVITIGSIVKNTNCVLVMALIMIL